jgi:5-methylcytosine-specific restriction enzyme B
MAGMEKGAAWELMGQADSIRAVLEEVFDERIHRNDRSDYQLRVNMQAKPDVASYAGIIMEEGNPTSGPYQGTSFVWFPGQGGSVAALVIGTDGFGADTSILARPGQRLSGSSWNFGGGPDGLTVRR